MRPVAQRLGERLHLQHGPIDLILSAEGPGTARDRAFAAAQTRFGTVLEELVPELAALRRPVAEAPRLTGAIARRMAAATHPYAPAFVTPMAAVAGAVADTVLAAMTTAAPLRRAYVNNGGDIALHLAGEERFVTAMQRLDNQEVGRIEVTADHPVRGIATSGRHGRSLSMGIADSVTVLATTAAVADVAATMLANAVDLPGHPAITRQPARAIIHDSDLGDRPVVTGVGTLTAQEVAQALDDGETRIDTLPTGVFGAALHLRGMTRVLGDPECLSLNLAERSLTYA